MRFRSQLVGSIRLKQTTKDGDECKSTSTAELLHRSQHGLPADASGATAPRAQAILACPSEATPLVDNRPSNYDDLYITTPYPFYIRLAACPSEARPLVEIRHTRQRHHHIRTKKMQPTTLLRIQVGPSETSGLWWTSHLRSARRRHTVSGGHPTSLTTRRVPSSI